MILEMIILLVVLAFFCEFIDSSLGMGYGTTLTPVLILLGFDILQIVPAVLLSEFITGIGAATLHHKAGNVNLKRDSLYFKVAMVLASCSIVGVLAAVFIAISLPSIYLKTYIGLLVLSIGLVILIMNKKNYKFSWKKIIGLGTLASFNKGISGGGYGPVMVGGQLLSGIDGKNAIGTTSLAEGLTCIVGVLAFLMTTGTINFNLALPLIIGAVSSVPFAVLMVKRIETKKLKITIGIVTVVLGISTLLKVIL